MVIPSKKRGIIKDSMGYNVSFFNHAEFGNIEYTFLLKLRFNSSCRVYSA